MTTSEKTTRGATILDARSGLGTSGWPTSGSSGLDRYTEVLCVWCLPARTVPRTYGLNQDQLSWLGNKEAVIKTLCIHNQVHIEATLIRDPLSFITGAPKKDYNGVQTKASLIS